MLSNISKGAQGGAIKSRGAQEILTLNLLIMTSIKLYIRFIVKAKELTKKGLAPVRCRLTYNKKRKDFSTGISVNPDYRDPKKQILLDQSDQEETINMQLSHIIMHNTANGNTETNN